VLLWVRGKAGETDLKKALLPPPPPKYMYRKGELMKQKKVFVVAAVLVLLVSLTAVTGYMVLNRKTNQTKEFYVGVTYCGSSVQEAKELIDKVKNYTNLFILQSGPLATNSEAINEIGDYACTSH
jgi:hypothetical protein